MRHAICACLVATASGLPACEIIAGLQDRVLVDAAAADAETPAGDETAAGTDASTSDAPFGGATDAAAPYVDEGTGSTGQDGASPADGSPGDATATIPGDAAQAGGDDAGTADAGAGYRDPGVSCANVAGGYIFCDDFDSVSSPSQGWDWTYDALDGGLLQIEDGGLSPPNDLEVTIPPVVGSDQLGESLNTVSSFTLAFDLRLDMDSLADISEDIIAQVLIAAENGADYELNYTVGPGAQHTLQLQIVADGGLTTAAILSLSPALSVHTWHHVTVSYDPALGVTTTQDGIGVASDATFSAGSGTGTLIIGDVYSQAGGTATLVYAIDNVVVQSGVQNDQ